MRKIVLALLTVITCTSAAHAADSRRGDLVLHAGAFSAPRDTTPSTQSFVGGAEYRWAPSETLYGLRPTVGALANADGAMYAYGGFNYDIPWRAIEPFVITPGVFAGAYSQGDSKDLGSWFEFREHLEVTYRFDSGYRVGASISHLSNASLGDSNPGVETVQAVFSMPM